MNKRPADYETRRRKQLARIFQKETGKKYTTCLREVEAMDFDQVMQQITQRRN